MQEMKTLNDIFTDWSGLFSLMPQSDFTEAYLPTSLDIMFFSEHGEKPISRLLRHYIGEDGTLSGASRQTIANMVWARYKEQWLHKLALLSLEYNPIDNVDYTMTEKTTHTGTDTLAKQGTETDTITKTGEETHTLDKRGTETDTTTYEGKETDTATKGGTETETETISGSETMKKNGSVSNTGNSTDNVFGFNSTEAVPSNSGTTNGTETFNDLTESKEYANRTNERETSFTNRVDENEHGYENRIDTTEHSYDNRNDIETLSFDGRQDTNTKSFNSREDINTKDLTDETTRHLSGNYNVTTTQDMMKQEIELWSWNFLNDVFADTAKMLALPIYCKTKED